MAMGQFGGGGKKKKHTFEKRDLGPIACEVCGAVVKNLHEQVTYNREQYGPKSPKGKKMPEEVVSDILDGVCEAEGAGGKWIRHLDIQSTAVDGNNKKRKLYLEGHDSAGKCQKECETIKKSCQNLLEEELEDRDDLQALLYVDKKFKKYAGDSGVLDLIGHVCKNMVGRCKKSVTYSTSKYEREDEEFIEVSEKDLEMEKLMAEMQGMGMGGQGLSMYDREDMEGMMGDYDPYGDDYDGYGVPGLGDADGNPLGGMGGGMGGGGMEL